MKQSEIKELSIAELHEKLEGFRKNYLELKMAHVISPLEKPVQLKDIRRIVARISTEITKRKNVN